MGGLNSGPRRELSRTWQMAQLREKGWTYAKIGKQFGITGEGARQAILLADGCVALQRIHCLGCGTYLGSARGPGKHNRGTYCLTCLPKHPEATFGQRLKAYRLALGLTQKEMAERIGKDHSTIAKFEHGVKEPTWTTLQALAKVLGVSCKVLGHRRSAGPPDGNSRNPGRR